MLNPPTPAGVFSGYASLFNRPDQAGDIVLPGAFADALREKGPGGVRMLFQHDPAAPIGVWRELREDARGLFVRGQLAPGVAQARELGALLAAGALDGLSIGFKTRRARTVHKGARRYLLQVDLWEISLVTFPMLPGARVHAVARAPSVSSPTS